MDFFETIMFPFKWLVSIIMVGFHEGLTAIGLPAAWLASGIVGVLIGGALAAIAFMGVKELARHHIGGHTGDVCGALQQMMEIAVLIGLALTAGD